MHKAEIIRAWKDEEYLASLDDEERASLPAHPAGVVDLSEESLGEAGGYTIITGCIPISVITVLLNCAPSLDITMSCCEGAEQT